VLDTGNRLFSYLAIEKMMGARVGAQGMTATPDDRLGFRAPTAIRRSLTWRAPREYYQAIGYTTPLSLGRIMSMRRSRHCAKPLTRSRVAIVTTAAPFDPAKGDQGPGAQIQRRAPNSILSMTATLPSRMDLRISHIAYDRVHTSAEDSGTWFLAAANCSGWLPRGGSAKVAPALLRRGPTNRSHPRHHRDRCA